MTNTTTPTNPPVDVSGYVGPLCPECAAGKHPNCARTALNADDEIVDCACTDRAHASGVTP